MNNVVNAIIRVKFFFMIKCLWLLIKYFFDLSRDRSSRTPRCMNAAVYIYGGYFSYSNAAALPKPQCLLSYLTFAAFPG
jgi:hypothetical protein